MIHNFEMQTERPLDASLVCKLRSFCLVVVGFVAFVFFLITLQYHGVALKIVKY